MYVRSLFGGGVVSVCHATTLPLLKPPTRVLCAKPILTHRTRKNPSKAVYFDFNYYLCIMKQKDVFHKVRKIAKAKLNDPDTRGAAKTVLDYIKAHESDD